METSTRIVLNGLLVLAAISLALLRSTRGKYWGPEGPVGGWLLVIPPLFLLGGVLVAMLAMGRFDCIAGGRPLSVVLWLGFLIASAVALGYVSAKPQTLWQSFVGFTPWIMLAGCFLALNTGPSAATLPKVLLAATLGTTALAGWVLTAAGAVHYVARQSALEASKVEQEDTYNQQHAAEFRALGAHAPLWNYFSYMYLSDETLRRQCRDLIAARPDLTARLIEYLGDPVLSEPATDYIRNIAQNPPAELAPAFARHMDTVLQDYRGVLRNEKDLSDRATETATALLAAAARIQKAGGNLQPQATAWRDYLRSFRNGAALAHNADELLQ